MSTPRRGLNHIKTLGRRGTQGTRQNALLRASIVEAELQRLTQERRRLEERVARIDEAVAEMQLERDRLIGELDVRQSLDRAPARRSAQTFHLSY